MGANASKEGGGNSVTPNGVNAVQEVESQQNQQQKIPKGCPMHEENTGTGQEKQTQPGEIPKGCPMHEENQTGASANQDPASQSGPVYNVYSQEINPDNKMPQNPNQQPAPGQQEALSTERQKSTIPKGGESDTWTYPSEQMFYNALVRKGKAEGVQEQDMKAVITIHNNMNERTWEKVKEWENLHQRYASLVAYVIPCSTLSKASTVGFAVNTMKEVLAYEDLREDRTNSHLKQN